MIVIDQHGGPADFSMIIGIARPAQIFVTRLPDGRIVSFAQINNQDADVKAVPYELQERLALS